MWTSRRTLAVLLFALSVGLRLGYAGWVGFTTPPPYGSDAAEYDQYAWNVAQGRGYRGVSPDVSDHDHLTAYRPPGTSLVWAGLYVVFGHRYAVVRVLNCVLGGVSVLLLLHIGFVSFRKEVAWAAAVVWAVFPTSVFYSAELSSESLMLVFLLGFVLSTLQFGLRPSLMGALRAGMLLGLTLLVHPSKAFLVPIVLVWALWQFQRNLKQCALSGVILVTALCMLSPWVIRNYRVFGEFIPFSTLGGSTLLQGNNRIVATDPALRGYVIWDTRIPEYAEQLQQPNNEIERDRVARTLALTWLWNNRDKWVILALWKLERGLTPLLQPGSSRVESLAMLGSWGPTLALSIIGFPVTLVGFLRRRDPSVLIHLTILHFLAITIVFFGYARYRYAVEPLFVLLASYTVLELLPTALRRLRPAVS
jgi:4-amino-4-deoxy-L-arabinose transferase-like glycosyltransferase